MGFLFSIVVELFILGLLGFGFFWLLSQADKSGLIQLPKKHPADADGGNTGAQKNAMGFVAWGRLWESVSTRLSRLTSSFMFRFGVVAVLTGLMQIPLGMLGAFVQERNELHSKVLRDISNIWGHKQDIQGPAIFVPYTEKFIDQIPMRNKRGKIMYNKKGVARKVKKARYEKQMAIVLPENLKIDMNIAQKLRKRGLYKAKVYEADLAISGYFQQPDNKKFSKNADIVHWEQAWFSVGISDTRAINKISRLDWNPSNPLAQKLMFDPGTKMTTVFKKGFHAVLPFAKQKKTKKKRGGRRGGKSKKPKVGSNRQKPKKRYDFAFSMNINGSKGLFFYPSGKTTNVSMKSDWPHPSFQGNVLPSSRHVSAKGFEAKWHVPHLARNFPQFWTLGQQSFDLKQFKAGVMMFESVSLYTKITRAIKYGLLFVGLTYMTFLIFELGIGRRLHIVQYSMIGLALTMFYLTLLSMAEHTGFLKAYVAAAALIITMISLYALAVMRKIGRALLIGTMLSGLYGTLYSLLQLESYALLSGTAMLLVILSLMMYLTRNIGAEKS